MAPLAPGTGGTITAATAEGAAFQILQWWQIKESDGNVNPNDQEYFTGSKNTDTNIFEGKWKLQVAIATDGQISAIPIYQNLGFIAGADAEITATTAEDYTLKLMLWLIDRQKDTNTSNPEKTINIMGTLNLNDGIIEGDFKLPYSTSLSPTGGTQDVAREYLI